MERQVDCNADRALGANTGHEKTTPGWFYSNRTLPLARRTNDVTGGRRAAGDVPWIELRRFEFTLNDIFVAAVRGRSVRDALLLVHTFAERQGRLLHRLGQAADTVCVFALHRLA